MEKVKRTRVIQQSCTRSIRDRLTAAAASYFPALPMVGAKQCFYLHHEDGSRFSNYILTAKDSELEWLEKMKMPYVLCEIIDDKGYIAIKLDFFNC